MEKRFSLRMPEEVWREVRRIARQEDRSMNDQIIHWMGDGIMRYRRVEGRDERHRNPREGHKHNEAC